MSITLNWTNRNANVTNYKVYRGTTKANMEVITTLPSSAVTYTDNDAVKNTLYYYQVNVVIGALDEVPGSIVPYAWIPDTGPGPMTLAAGTYEWGFFGTLLPTDFITDSVYKALSTTGTAFSTAITNWYKFAYKGKILYIADNPCRNQSVAPTTFAKALYTEGVYLGTGDSSLPYSSIGATATPQTKRTTFDVYEFIVRAPKGNETTPPNVAGVYNSSALLTVPESLFSEANLIASGSTAWRPPASAITDSLIPPKVFNGILGIYQNGWHITQHFNSSSAIMLANNGGHAFSLVGNAANSSIACYYLPVLELVYP